MAEHYNLGGKLLLWEKFDHEFWPITKTKVLNFYISMPDNMAIYSYLQE
jgi:hypothetical protein